jgi:hypothetical protein
MAADYNKAQYEIEETSVDVTVPNNPTARLMYYINSICCVLEFNDAAVTRYQEYKYYYDMTRQDQLTIKEICLLLKPDIFKDKVIFEADDLGDSGNKFFKIGEQKLTVAAVESFIIGGVSRRVAQIMFYTPQWLMRNYYTPLRNLNEELNRPAIRYVNNNYPPTITSQPCTHHFEDNYCTVCGVCCCICWFPLGLICLPICKETKCIRCGKQNG